MQKELNEIHDRLEADNWGEEKLDGIERRRLIARQERAKTTSAESNSQTGGEVQFQAREIDGDGKSYWQIESDKDIFANLTTVKALKKAAYDFILNGDKGNKVTDIIDGEALEFIRVSAGEYVYGDNSTTLTEEEYKQKMRMSTSIIDLIENADIAYDAPDHKNHKMFPDGFKNYQGRVGIDSTIFKYIVRVGKARWGKVFYDICLEVDGRVPRAKRTSPIKSSTSTISVSQNPEKSTPNVKIPENSNNVQAQNRRIDPETDRQALAEVAQAAAQSAEDEEIARAYAEGLYQAA